MATVSRSATTLHGFPLLGSSGDRDLDRALAETLSFLSENFQILPDFAFYNDGNSPNALATSATDLGRADGAVLYGLGLLRRQLKEDEHPDAHIAAVCAHEFGHICQFKSGADKILAANYPTGKRVELHADYLAGVFAGLRKKQRTHFPAAVVALAHWNIGDFQNSHGTPEERGRAVVEGFKAIMERGEAFKVAFAKGVEYAQSIQ